jgi:hypothetical protein
MTSSPSASRSFRLFAAALLVAAGAAAPLAAAGRSTDEALTLVPPDAASVALLRLNELRSSPLSSRIFHDMDHISADGEAARFMAEARLDPRTAIDTVVISGLSASGPTEGALAIFEGRFDPDRLATAALEQGASKVTGAGGTYYLLPDKSSSGESGFSGHGRSAAAFLSSHLVVVGTEGAVAQALVARAAGGTAFTSGAGLGAHLSRVSRASSAWAIVDVTKYPAVQKGLNRERSHAEGSETANALVSAMKGVTLFTVQATVKADSLDLAASGVARDAETRQLLEDSLRGVIAMLRLAVQDKQPDLVPVLRRFQVQSDGDAVTISGNLPASVLKTLTSKSEKEKRAGK